MTRTRRPGPLLTAAEERELAQAMEVGRAARVRLGTPDERSDDHAVAAAGSAARLRFIESNIRLVQSIANKAARPSHVDLEDIVQDGMIGLDTAVERFDWRRGFKFSTYATWWIRQSIQRGLETSASSARIPTHRRRELRQARDVVHQHGMQRPVSIADGLAVVAGLVDADSTDRRLGDGSVTVGELIGCGDPGPEEMADRLHSIESVRAALVTLDAKSRDAIVARFGLGGEPPATYTAIGERLGISPQAVRKRVDRALERIRPQVMLSVVA